MKVEIFKEVKSATQSGRGKSKKWVIKPLQPLEEKYCEPIMGWSGSNNTISQLVFKFETRQKAIDFAKASGFEYLVSEPLIRKIGAKSYAENFTK